MKRGKKYKKSLEKIDPEKKYSIKEALELIKELSFAKFDESVELHIRTSVDAKKGDQQVRGTVTLPHGTGKTKKVAVVTSTKQDEAKKAGADVVGAEDLIEKMKTQLNFDILLATPEMMPKLAKVAKILGPKGLMPNPKTETVTEKIKETVESLKKGKVAFKNDNSGNIHQIVGRLSFGEEKLEENSKAFIKVVEKSKPDAVKGKLIEKISMSSTMSPGVKINY